MVLVPKKPLSVSGPRTRFASASHCRIQEYIKVRRKVLRPVQIH